MHGRLRTRGLAVSVGVLSLVAASGCVIMASDFEPVVAGDVDLNRYAGLWFEIASIPSIASSFGRCTNTTATYTLQEDGTVRVFNLCFLDTFDGFPNFIFGTARAFDETNARLALRFDFGLFEAPYNILDVDPDYQWAIVGSGDDGLFFLSRTPQISDELYQDLLTRAEGFGYDTSRLLLTPQPDPNAG